MSYWIADADGNRLVPVDEQPVTIGRTSRVTVRVDDQTVSRVQCVIYRSNEDVVVSDVGSRNGTFLDGERIATERIWPVGGVLTLAAGIASFTLVAQSEKPAADAPAAGASVRGAAAIALPALVLWLLVSQAVFLGQVFAALHGFLRTAGPEAEVVEKDTGGPPTLAEEIDELRRALGADDVPESAEFEGVLAESVRTYADSPEFAVALQRRSEYLPRIREVFDEHNVPAVFSVLPIVESYFHPRAWNRRTNARGMWQFRPATARQYGLVITSNRDDRLDPIASTRAAAEYLRDLLAVFGHHSISLVAAAYNAGDSRVRFALRQIEDPDSQRNFWYLSGRRLLPRETREYVVKALAAAILAARWDGSTDGLR